MYTLKSQSIPVKNKLSFVILSALLKKIIFEYRDMSQTRSAGSESLLAGGLAMALTYINRVKAGLGPTEKVNPRLVLSLCDCA